MSLESHCQALKRSENTHTSLLTSTPMLPTLVHVNQLTHKGSYNKSKTIEIIDFN